MQFLARSDEICSGTLDLGQKVLLKWPVADKRWDFKGFNDYFHAGEWAFMGKYGSSGSVGEKNLELPQCTKWILELLSVIGKWYKKGTRGGLCNQFFSDFDPMKDFKNKGFTYGGLPILRYCLSFSKVYLYAENHNYQFYSVFCTTFQKYEVRNTSKTVSNRSRFPATLIKI